MSPVDQKPRTDPTESSPEEPKKPSKRKREGTVLALFFAGALLASTYPLPYRVFAALFAVLAVVWAVRYFIAGARDKQGGNWVVLGSIATIGSLYILLTTLGTIAVWPVQQEYEECVRAAVTQQASITCTAEYNEGLRSWFEQMTGQPYPG